MQLSVSGIHIDVGDVLRNQISEKIESMNQKWGLNPIECAVQISKETFQFRTDISFHLGKGVIVRGGGLNQDAYISFEEAINHLSRRLSRHKKRLLSYHKHQGHRHQKQMVPYYVIDSEEESPVHEDASAPIIAEMEKEVPTLRVSDAVMHLDLSQEPAMLFRNEVHGHLNMVYRRSDGNIGWVDPVLQEAK